jgi:translation initiation factor 2B subunit (eIF-2B alpha/beta/delta family)
VLSKAFLKDIETIHNDTHSGASKIALNCLTALKQECLSSSAQLNRSFLKTAIQLLLDTHPMATIENALLPVYVRLVQLIDSDRFTNEDIKPSIDMIFATRKEQLRIGEDQTRETLVERLMEVPSILTFSHSSTVIKALLNLAKEGYTDKEIYILESRPLKEGGRTAYSLANAGYKKVILGVDFAIFEFTKLAEVAVMGADMLHENGEILNKIGSATIAKLFHNLGKEVIVAASMSKICLRGIIERNHDWHPIIPQRNSKEVTNINHPNLTIWNKYFEVIPPDYISTLIMDQNSFENPIGKHLTHFIKTSTLADQINILRDIWNDVDFTMV